MRVILLVIGLQVVSASIAQERTHLSPSLRAFVSTSAPQEPLDLFLRGNVDCLRSLVVEAGGHVKMIGSNVINVRIPTGSVHALDGWSCLTGIEFSLDRGQALNDSMRVHNRIDPVHAGVLPLQVGFDGSGVIMGIIDSGLDMDHPDFKDASGNTRVLKFWDQRKPVNGTTPLPYGYGQVCDSAAINAGTCTFGEQPGYFGHGTTVTGTATGTGMATGTNLGAAPGADLIIVSSNFNAANWRSVVADAVDYIFNQADSLGMPAVINASLGTYLGSHDGKDAAALFIDSLLLAKEGRVMVCAAGNSQTAPPYHLHTEVSSDTSFTWFEYNPSSSLGYGAVYFELWADTAELNNVSFAIGADTPGPPYDFRGATTFRNVQSMIGMSLMDTLFSISGNQLGVVEYWAELRGGQYHLVVNMEEPDSSQYLFRFMSTGIGSFDVWTADFFGYSKIVTAIPGAATYPDIVNYVLPDNEQTMVDSWACSDQVITVANYYNEVSYLDVDGNVQTVPGVEGDIAASSSSGPTRDGRVKPDIGATGDITLTAAPLATLAAALVNERFKVAQGSMHFRNGGTSMASPVVSGAAALYLEKCNKATHTEVKSELLGTAVADGFTGTVPNNRWGVGKLNAFDALVQSNYVFDISVFGDSALCPGDSMLISGPILSTFLWSSGDTTKMFWLDTPGPLYGVATNNSGCISYSDTIDIIQYTGPATPTITLSGNTISSSPAQSYQWYFEGGPLGGETGQQLTVSVTGNYHVVVMDTNGCSAASDSIFYLHVGLAESSDPALTIWPVPAEQVLNYDISSFADGSTSMDFTIIDALGKNVLTWSGNAYGTVDLRSLRSGAYRLVVSLPDGRRMVNQFSVAH